jgi:hypothetical protein
MRGGGGGDGVAALLRRDSYRNKILLDNYCLF